MDLNRFRNWLHLHFEEVLEANNGTEFRVNCPFCESIDTNFHMYISKTKYVGHCFRCNWSGHRNDFILKFLGYNGLKEYLANGLEESYIPLASRLEEFMGTFESSGPQSQDRPEILRTMPDWFVRFDAYTHTHTVHTSAIYRYAISRIGIDNVIRYAIGYCKEINSKYANRMIIPIGGIFFQARAISENQKAKYVNPNISVEDRLFNGITLELCDHVYVCEGAISAIALGNNAIATLSKFATKKQIERMVRSKVRKFTIAYDSGTEYSPGTLKLADALYKNGKIVIVRSYKEGDPDSCSVFTECLYDMKYSMTGRIINFSGSKPINLFSRF